MNRFLVTVIVIMVVGITIYSYQSMNDDSIYELDDATELREDSSEEVSATTDVNKNSNNVISASQQAIKKTSPKKDESGIADEAFPFDIKLLGLVYSKDPSKSYTQLNNEGQISEFAVDDQVNDTSVYVKRINKNSVVLEFESVDYELRLGETNSLEESQLLVEFDEMTAKEIGSRPRKIEHIVRLLPNLFNDGGKLIIPGQNPDLFSAARFKEGDVLLEVNDFDIDDESSFAELQKHVRNAQTLKFVVNRAGRRVTLYLDIPSEALKL
ncbi:hypothetical protein [Glaciecola sp. MF2-115]|uniref:hypothetical protein n=1 Tax=Glaciecola sp. MF2-115 TaxID=3384827 RepID=UPI0039A39DAB